MQGYICHDCATKRAAIWPEGHIATSQQDNCPYCDEYTDLCHIFDWDWSQNPRYDALMKESKQG